MNLVLGVFILVLGIFASAVDVQQNSTKIPDGLTTANPNATTVVTTSTVPPTTSTVKPTNSTTTSTTSKPTPTGNSTTTVQPTTPLPPTTPSPLSPYWKVVDQEGKICILASMNIKVELKYKTQDESTDNTMLVPRNATASGSCGETEQYLKIQWRNNEITFGFNSPNNSKEYHMDSLNASIELGSEKFELGKSKLELFKSSKNTSYTCSYADPIDVKQNETLIVTMTDLHLEAFMSSKKAEFSQAMPCPESPDIVPIVVGVALVILIVAVLLAYLISRRRSAARGYLSM